MKYAREDGEGKPGKRKEGAAMMDWHEWAKMAERSSPWLLPEGDNDAPGKEKSRPAGAEGEQELRRQVEWLEEKADTFSLKERAFASYTLAVLHEALGGWTDCGEHSEAKKRHAEQALKLDPDIHDAACILAQHHCLMAARNGTPVYYAIRDNDSDDGSYVLREDLVLEDADLEEARGQALRGLPHAVTAVRYAERAIAADALNGSSLFALERSMEALADAGGTLLAVAAESRRRSEEAKKAS